MLRIRLELVPHGVEALAETTDEVLIANDGTGIRGGADKGGRGNYDIFDNETLEHLHGVDYPGMYACGRVEGLARSTKHRLQLAELAIGVVRESRETEDRPTRRLDHEPA